MNKKSQEDFLGRKNEILGMNYYHNNKLIVVENRVEQ